MKKKGTNNFLQRSLAKEKKSRYCKGDLKKRLSNNVHYCTTTPCSCEWTSCNQFFSGLSHQLGVKQRKFDVEVCFPPHFLYISLGWTKVFKSLNLSFLQKRKLFSALISKNAMQSCYWNRRVGNVDDISFKRSLDKYFWNWNVFF